MTSDERNDAIPYSQSRLWTMYWQKCPGEQGQFSPRSESSLNVQNGCWEPEQAYVATKVRQVLRYGGRRLTLRQNQKKNLFSFFSSQFLVTLFKIFFLEYSQLFERYFLRHSLGATLRGILRGILRGTLRGFFRVLFEVLSGVLSRVLFRVLFRVLTFYEVLRKKKKIYGTFRGTSREVFFFFRVISRVNSLRKPSNNPLSTL